MNPAARRRAAMPQGTIAAVQALENRTLLAAVAFATPVTTSLATSQFSTTTVATADLNGDGVPDLVVGHNNGSGQVFLGSKTGTFTPGTLVGPGAQLLAVATFGTATRLGLATAVAVLPGNGNGTFGTALSANNYVLPANTVALYAADVNGDGTQDLVAATLTPAAQSGQAATLGISVLLGTSTGGFHSAISTPVGTAAGLGPADGANFQFDDFNGDGKVDALTPLGVMLGNGNGTFASPIAFPQPPGSSGSSGSGSGSGGSSSGSGAGSGAPSGPAVPVGTAVAVADLNGDGNLDVALLPQTGSAAGQVDILLGKGDGTFSNGTPISMGTSATVTALAAADLNADGSPDLIVGTASAGANGGAAAGAVQVLINNGAGTFGAPTALSAPPGQPISITAADFNADGNLDLLVITEPAGTASGIANNQVTIPAANASVYVNQKATPVTPVVTLGVSAARVTAGAPLTFTAVLSPPPPPPVVPGKIPTSTSSPVPTGTVTFMEGTQSVGTATLANGRAKLAATLGGVGTQAITAVYGGDVAYAGATSAVRNVVVLLSSAATPLLVPTLSAATVPALFLPRDSGSVTVSFTNGGAGVASGRVSIDLFLSTSKTLGPSAITIAAPSLQNRTLAVGAGGTAAITGAFTLGTYPAGTYFLIAQIVPVARLTTDELTAATLVDNTRIQAAGLVFGTVGAHKGLTLPLSDAAGNRAVLSIAGNGTGTATQANGGTDLTLSGTDASSRLLITPTRGSMAFDAITDSGALAAITGNRATVTRALTIGGSIGAITVAGLGDGGAAPVTLGSGATTTLSLGTVAGVDLTAAAAIRSLTATSWVGGRIIAASIQTLTVRGTFDPDVIVHGSGTIGTATLGAVDAGTWAVGGGIGALHVSGDLANARILAGADLGADDVLGTSDDRYGVASIASVFIGGADATGVIAAGAAPAPGGTIAQRIVLLPKGAIRSIVVRGTVSDDARFLAAVLPTHVRFAGAMVSPAGDPHFQP